MATYQGRKNYQTWAAKLWIDNEYSLYKESHGSCEISREIVHGQNVYVPLDGSGAIAAIHREWGELESETRQAIARRKQAYSHL